MSMDTSNAPGTPKASNTLGPADRMKYVLEHFKYLADQRMKTFNYYAIVVAASITGSVTAFDKCPWQMVVAMGMVHLAMAWIFFIIDIRNCRLVHCTRQALIHFENQPESNLDPQLRVITCDEQDETTTRSAPIQFGHQSEVGHPRIINPSDEQDHPGNVAGTQRKRWDKKHPFRGIVFQVLGRERVTFTAAFNAAFLLQITCGICLIAAAWWLKGPGVAVAAH